MALDFKILYSWTNYCRLCLLDDGIMLPLFETDGVSQQLGHKIESCFQLATYEGDPLPRMICHKCFSKVNQTYEFRTMALNSFERLKTHLLKLQHVPEVHQYLEKADQLQRPEEFNARSTSQFPTPPSSKGGPTTGLKIRIKSERELMGDPSCSPCPESQLSSVAQDSSFSEASCNGLPAASLLRERIPSCDDESVLHDSLKRKRFCLTADNSTHTALENTVSSVLKKVKRKKQLARPASRKRPLQNSAWKCLFCLSVFGSKHGLNTHLEKCLKCGTCLEEFGTIADKAIHEADKHISVFIDSEMKHLRKRCSRCPARFASGVMLSMHSKYDHGPYMKSVTDQLHAKSTVESSSASASSLFVHEEIPNYGSLNEETKLNDARESDGDSPQSHSSFTNQAKHEHINPTSTHRCSTCSEFFLNAPLLLKHEKVIHSIFRCSQCSGSFNTQGGLNSHQRFHMSKQANSKKSSEKDGNTLKKTAKNMKTLSCHTCYEEFDNENSFILHLYKHATEQSDDERIPTKKSRKIETVPKSKKTTSVSSTTTISSSDGLDNPAEQFSVKCERCRVVCRSKEYYQVHLATHMSKAKTSFPCSGCNQDFRNVEALNRHTCCGKQSDSMQTCCLDCGQALMKDEDHVCDNKCPECDKVFKSSRGQRLHFVSKHRSRGPVEDGDFDDAQLLELDTNPIDLEDDHMESVPDEKLLGKEESHAGGPSESEYCTSDSEASSFMGDGPRTARLPPDGAPLDEPEQYKCNSVSENPAPLTALDKSLVDNSNTPVIKEAVPLLPLESNLVPPLLTETNSVSGENSEMLG